MPYFYARYEIERPNMIIDIHTHVFPEKIAARALESLVAGAERNFSHHGVAVSPRGDGTARDLLSQMDGAGVLHAVLCPVATNEKSVDGINRATLAEKSERLLPFAALYPHAEHWEATLEKAAESGFCGLKLHPEFQECFADSDRMVAVVKRATALGLPVLLHAGRDPGYPPPSHSTPERLRRLFDRVPDATLIAAHMGGWREWDSVVRFLADTNVYLDTSFVYAFLAPEEARAIVDAVTPRRILFGTDWPWGGHRETLDYVRALGLGADDEEKILCENAKRLLHL